MFAPARQTLLLLRQRLPRVAPRLSMPRLRCHLQMSTAKEWDIYTAFPATLYHYNTHGVPFLYDNKERPNRPDDLHDQAVNVAEDGLVYPAVGLAFCRDPILVCGNVGRH